MKIADVRWAARQGKTELALSEWQMAELIDDLTDDQRYGVPIPPPFWLFGVWIACAETTTPAAVPAEAEAVGASSAV